MPLASFCLPVDSTKAKKIDIGFSYSSDYCYRTLKADASNKWIADSRNEMEIPKIGYTVGLNLAYKLNTKLVVEAGVLFSDKGEKTRKISYTESASGQSERYTIYKYHYNYLDIPIKVNYYFPIGKFKLYATAGVSTNIFLNEKITTVQGHSFSDAEKNTVNTYSKFSRINLSMLIGAGLNYNVSEKMFLKAEPIYTRSITSIVNAPVKSYLYSVGLNLGVYYKL
jgi:opacity protein-like surface antigen